MCLSAHDVEKEPYLQDSCGFPTILRLGTFAHACMLQQILKHIRIIFYFYPFKDLARVISNLKVLNVEKDAKRLFGLGSSIITPNSGSILPHVRNAHNKRL